MVPSINQSCPPNQPYIKFYWLIFSLTHVDSCQCPLMGDVEHQPFDLLSLHYLMSISQINRNHQWQRGKSWAGAEDECLCHAWLHASEDLITGTGQKKDSFWNAIVRHFIKLLPAGELSAPQHIMSSMQARWALISKDATKFCTLMDQVHSMPWSGWTNDMYMDKALKLFKEERESN